MLGMIKKDLFMIKNNYKAILVAFAIYLFYSFQFDMDMSFFIPFIGLMSCISTISYDDFNNWHAYASSLPYGKAGVVKSKYITTILVTFILTLLSIFMNFLTTNIKGNFNLNDLLSTFCGEICIIVFMMSVLFPILFKLGAEKGRLAMLLMGLGIFGLITLITKINPLNISENLIIFFDLYFPIIIIIISVIMVLISYYISKKIYLKKEF